MTGHLKVPIILFLLGLLAAAAALVVGHRLHQASGPGVVTLDLAWRTVRMRPESSQAWAALGDAQTAMDHVVAAEHSYRTAIRLGTNDPHLHGRLGFLLFGRGRDQEALEYLKEALQGGAELPMLGWTIAQLEKRLSAPDAPGATSTSEQHPLSPDRTSTAAADEAEADAQVCSIKVSRSQELGTFTVAVRLGEVQTRLIVDTGASVSALTREVIESLDLEPNEDRVIHAITATGPATFPTVIVPLLEVAGRSTRDLTVAVCEACGGSQTSGLLGLDAQAALGMELRVTSGEIMFSDCAATEDP